jgi:hypothetical protein
MIKISSITEEILSLTREWEPKLTSLSEDIISHRRNNQNRTIKQILGHLIDSASNNTHRIVHLQYQPSPLVFPNYASLGNNDRWIAIQNFQEEDWKTMVQLWKYSLLHISHVIRNIRIDKMKNEWISAPGKNISLEALITDFTRHLKLHLSEINDLMNKK